MTQSQCPLAEGANDRRRTCGMNGMNTIVMMPIINPCSTRLQIIKLPVGWAGSEKLLEPLPKLPMMRSKTRKRA